MDSGAADDSRLPARARSLRSRRSSTGFSLLATVVAVWAACRLGTGQVEQTPAWLPTLALVVAAGANIEVGRVLEGRRCVAQRPHKALSAWALAAAVLVPPVWVLAVVASSYAHAWWRGVRPPVEKWVGSAAFLVLAGLAAAPVTGSVGARPLTAHAVLFLATAVVLFLAVESALFWTVAGIGDPEDERWLRETLSAPAFYVTELTMLSVGALAVLLWTAHPVALLFLAPVFVLVQQAALHTPLRAQARTDDKTGLLRYEAWRSDALTRLERASQEGPGWAVALLDLDHFKAYNDGHGHLAGDRALLAVADVLRQHTRAPDLLGRFGGEEFVLLLSGVSPADAAQVLERLRSSVGELVLERPITISGGLVTGDASGPSPVLAEVLLQADRALYEAKATGRNRLVHRQDCLRPAPVG